MIAFAGDGCYIELCSFGSYSMKKDCFEHEWSDAESSNQASQSYKRLGRGIAVLTDWSSCTLHGAAFSPGHRGFKYELSFDSPTHGQFRAYDCQKYCNVVQLIGRFWLKDLPPQLPSHEPPDSPAAL